MSHYVLSHHLQGEGKRLALMSKLLDPMHRRQIEDYHIGRTLAPRLAALGLNEISGIAETAVYNGGSRWADYWTQTITELRDDLTTSRKLSPKLVDTFLEFCADSNWWTQTIAFTAVHGRAPAA
jgi:hypothetical protein